MRKGFLIICSLLLSSYAFAAEFKCRTLINLQEVSSTTVKTDGAKKIVIDDGTEAISYLSEKSNGGYTVEAYMYNYDMRLYSEGPASSERDLSLSMWSRDVIYEVSCRSLK
ncbi:hypothetical protein [Pseudobdellovibrio exovorus]|uniref:Uncharacterized protein n=1 Tax=Pseudobdellovibrio exovorus JSS TaxID=1184267 RepID=M4V8J3_9BACT|nr:hypothetical protein [Pseudobdellovibrio exovorus]AGH95513.1 hypothetical protein A11Q_1297 [Pseudobdellovibrio exovorus JSS]